MPAVFNVAALKLPLVQLLSLPQAAKASAQKVPPGQAQQAAQQSAPTAAAPNGAGAPMATGAALPPSAQIPVPAPPPVVSTSLAGRVAAAAINGLARTPEDRKRKQQGRSRKTSDVEEDDPPQNAVPCADAVAQPVEGAARLAPVENSPALSGYARSCDLWRADED